MFSSLMIASAALGLITLIYLVVVPIGTLILIILDLVVSKRESSLGLGNGKPACSEVDAVSWESDLRPSFLLGA